MEIAWSPRPGWSSDCAGLVRRFPDLALGAASICSPEALRSAAAAGFTYAVSPVLDRALLDACDTLDLTLVPGVMTPTEVHQARQWGCPLVKLFPAAALGQGYWSGLRRPLGNPLPFCIAAGGIRPDEVMAWLQAGVDAVTLGSGLLEGGERVELGPSPAFWSHWVPSGLHSPGRAEEPLRATALRATEATHHRLHCPC